MPGSQAIDWRHQLESDAALLRRCARNGRRRVKIPVQPVLTAGRAALAVAVRPGATAAPPTRRSTGRPTSPGSSTPGSCLAERASRRVPPRASDGCPVVPDERTRRVFQLHRRPLARRVPRRGGIALSDVAVATANAVGADGMSGQPAAGALRRPISAHQAAPFCACSRCRRKAAIRVRCSCCSC